MAPAEFLVPFESLLAELEHLAGGRIFLLVHLGAVLLVWWVVGRFIARHILRSDTGALGALLAAVLPWIIGGAVWGVVAALYNPDLFALGPVAVDLARLCGLLGGLFGGLFLIQKLLSGGCFSAVLFAVLSLGAAAGALVVSSASLTVFESGVRTVEEREGAGRAVE